MMVYWINGRVFHEEEKRFALWNCAIGRSTFLKIVRITYYTLIRWSIASNQLHSVPQFAYKQQPNRKPFPKSLYNVHVCKMKIIRSIRWHWTHSTRFPLRINLSARTPSAYTRTHCYGQLLVSDHSVLARTNARDSRLRDRRWLTVHLAGRVWLQN